MSAHYERLAGAFDQHWTYGEDFLDWMARETTAALGLTSRDRIIDVGCGTGLHTRRILDLVRPSAPILCADPSKAMLGQLSPEPGLRPLHASAEQLALLDGPRDAPSISPGSLDAVIVKEAIHHVAPGERAEVIAGLAELLDVGGRFLIVMLPTRIAYPLFDAARKRFEELQPNPPDIATHMRTAGLNADVTYHDYPLSIPKDRYLTMVRSRYMSLLSTFDDEEIRAGIAEIETRHPEPILSFPDRFAFVLGRRDA